MFDVLPISIILLYCCFSTLVYYQQLHVKNFQGASQIFQLILSLFAFAGIITGFVFLIYYGIKVVWWAPIILFVIGILFQFIANFIEEAVGPFTLSFLGFAAWPLCAFFMFRLTPSL